MFAVIFEVQPKQERFDDYLAIAGGLKPKLEAIEGFIDNQRFRNKRDDRWLLSLSTWRDEKALVRWRTQARHHTVQEKGRSEIFLDYHLRIGQVTQDSNLPDGHVLEEQRLDETETGDATTITLIDAKRPPEWVKQTSPDAVAKWLGLAPNAPGLEEAYLRHEVAQVD